MRFMSKVFLFVAIVCSLGIYAGSQALFALQSSVAQTHYTVDKAGE